jgi:hypothetical protein
MNAKKIKGIEVAHHMPQNAYMEKTLGIHRNDGPAVLMTIEDHMETRTYGGKGKGTMRVDDGLGARSRLAQDIWDIRSRHGSNCNEALLKTINYAKTLPDFKK